MKLPRLYAHPGELCPRVAFIVTNLTRPSRAHRCSLQPTGEQSIKESKRRDMPHLRRRRRPPAAPCSRAGGTGSSNPACSSGESCANHGLRSGSFIGYL
jgi:hypothetical protein